VTGGATKKASEKTSKAGMSFDRNRLRASLLRERDPRTVPDDAVIEPLRTAIGPQGRRKKGIDGRREALRPRRQQ
jgi:hypothetical protein